MEIPFEWVVGDSSKGLHGDRAHVYDETGHRELHHLKGHYSDMSATAIASELFISANTARSHIKSIYRKLGATTRADAVTAARQAALIG